LSRHPRDLHPFPTRRSSDLPSHEIARIPAIGRHEVIYLGALDQDEPRRGDGSGNPNAELGLLASERPTSKPADSGIEQAHLLERDRKSTRLNSSHLVISYAV